MAAPHTHRSLSSLQRAGLIIGVIAFVIPFIIDVPGLDETGERMLGIFLLAVVFWVTEAIPLVATATVIIALEALLIAQGAILPVGEGAPTAAAIFSVFGNPAVILIMGGFMIANGATKFGLDQNLAAIFIRPFASSGRKLVLGVMIVTTVLGQFISNTATTAAMFAIVMPILATISSVPTRTAIALGIPLAASIGGMGSPVGTPPNAIAVGALVARRDVIRARRVRSRECHEKSSSLSGRGISIDSKSCCIRCASCCKSTAMTISAPMARARDTGTGLTTAPSTSQ